MNEIFETIKADSIVHRKAKSEVVGLYSTLIGEIQNEASRDKSGDKTITDVLVIKILKTFSKNLEETARISGETTVAGVTALHEKSIIDWYIPKQMTENDLRIAINHSGFTNIKDIMSFLKTNHAGNYDGKIASAVAKEFI